MSDNLRARIGAVQMAHMPDDYQRDMGECPCGFKYAKWSELASHVADAVIRELGLRVEYGMGAQNDYSENPEIHPVTKQEMERRTWYGEDFTFRYVTGWKADDE